jgi:hypothetical protein
MGNSANAPGFKSGISFDATHFGSGPISTTGRMIEVVGAQTVTDFIYAPNLIVTGAFIRGPASSFVVSGTGQITTNITGGGFQCLHVNATGTISGTGSECGSGGGGTPALTHTHLFVGNASALAADFGAMAAISDTGVFTLTPTNTTSALIVSRNTAAAPGPVFPTLLQLVAPDTDRPAIELDAFANGPPTIIGTRSSGGLATSKSALGAGFGELLLLGAAYNGTANVTNAEIGFATDNPQSGTDSSSTINFFATAKTTTTIQQIATLWGGGGLAIGPANVGTDPGVGRVLATNLTLAGLAGTGSRCMHVDATGAVAALASDCGSGGGGITSITSTGSTLTVTTPSATNIELNLGHANTWTALQAHTGGVTTNTLTVSGLTAGGLVFAGAGGAISTDSSIYFDATTKRLCAGGISLANCTETASGLTGTVANIQGTNGANAWVIWNNNATPKQVFQMRPSSVGAGIFDLTNGTGQAVIEMRGDSNPTYFGVVGTGGGPVGIGTGPAITGVTGELAFPKITPSATAPGAGVCKIAFVADTAGACKMVAYCGTSSTSVDVKTTIGSGC